MEIIELKAENFDMFFQMRLQLFKVLGEVDETTNLEELELASKEYYNLHIGKDLFCWGVIVDTGIVSAASLCLFSRLPYPGNLQGKEGHILSVYTLPQFRKKGMAQALVNTIIDHSKRNGIKRIWLKNSQEGKSVYKRCGFTEKSEEMEFYCR